jgi:hypothetical protein
VPLRVAAAIDRALEKDPAQRFPSMDAFAAELEACLTALDSPDEDDAAQTMIAAPLASMTRSRARRRVSPWAIGLTGVALLALAALLIGLFVLGGNGSGGLTSKPVVHSVRLVAAGTFDPPPGDGHEHNEAISNAVDGSTGTYWSTETYKSFQKPGVGLVLSTGAAAPKITRVTIQTDTPGFTAQLKTGTTLGRFHALTSPETIQSGTTFSVDAGSVEPYLVVWITELPAGFAHVNEVRAR